MQSPRRPRTTLVALAACVWTSLHPAVLLGAPARTAQAESRSAVPDEGASRAAVRPVATGSKNAGRAPAAARPRGPMKDARRAGAGASPASPSGPSAPETTEPAPVTPLALPKGDSAISANAIALPSGPATVSGMGESFSAQLTTGIATLNVPFAMPRARGSAQPALGLVYSSSGGYGVAGVGWSLVGPAFIARQTDRGVPRYDDQPAWHPEQDRFVFGAQELVPICKVSTTLLPPDLPDGPGVFDGPGDGPLDGGPAACPAARPGEIMPVWANGWQYFRARVEVGFLRFFWSPDHRTWRIQSKDGTNLELGVPLDGTSYTGALEANPTRPDEIYRWHVARQYDSHGDVNGAVPAPANPVVFRYASDAGVQYLSDIFCSAPAANPGTTDLSTFAHHARIAYESRPDTAVSYRAGFAQDQRLRLARLDVTSKPFTSAAAPRELVRRYHLEYDSTTHASLLLSVQMQGRCAAPLAEAADGSLAPSMCARLPPVTFEYERVEGDPGSAVLDSAGLEFERLNEILHDLPGSPPHSLDETETSLVDVDADSLPDVVVTAPGLFAGKHGLFLNGAGGEVGFETTSGMTVTGVPTIDTGVLRLSNSNVAGLDLDADARVDLVHMPMVKKYSIFTPKLSGSQWTWAGREVTTATGLDPKIDFTRDARRTAVMDVNGDGLVDVVFSSSTEIQTFFSLGRYPGGDGRFGNAVWTGPMTAALSDEPAKACVPWSALPARFGDDDVRVADMNGDGLPDIVRARSGQILYWPGQGNGFWGTGERDDCAAGSFAQDRHIEMTNAPYVGVVQPGTLQVADVNGDGMSDMVEVRFNAVDVFLNDNGTGFTDRYTLSNVPIKPNSGNPVRLTDIDGSGTIDILWGHGYEYRYVDLAGGVRPHVLVRTHNGLGKTTELEYRASTELMLAAETAGQPWSKVMPLTTPVIVRATVKDNLEKVGRAAGTYVTEYGYRDPVFEGRQREFRGFSVAETRSLGDSNSPTSTTRSTFLLGECEVAENGFDACDPAERWQDNWREALKGLPALVESFDESGAFLSTAHTAYELRQLYTGMDGRRVVAAFSVKQESFGYDTAPFVSAPAPVTLDELTVNLDGITQSESRTVTRRASAGTVRIRGHQVIDDFGNVTSSTAEGCADGCAAPDEQITTTTTHTLVAGNASGWLFRPASSFVTGSAQTAARRQMAYTYDAFGDVVTSTATLYGTLALDRSHSGGGAVAPAPPDASGGIAAPVDITLMQYTRDQFGSVTATRAALDRCRTVTFDSDYAELPVLETVFGGDRGPGGCGTRAFTTTALYDRGLMLLTDLAGITGQPARLAYDGFGRLVARFVVDPATPGVLGALPAITYSYALPADAALTPFSRVAVRSQDGASPNSTEYLEQHSYVDGLGRPLAVLAEADPSAGDGGSHVASGFVHYDKKGAPLRSFEAFFWTGDPAAFPLGTAPATRFASQQYDAFGRPIAAFGLDGQMKVKTHHHALSRDVWDAEDLLPGPHMGTFSTARADGHGRAVQSTERIRAGGVGGAMELRHALREYLPTGEVTRITHRRAGSPDTVRWMRYDSLGRLVLNVEPNTSVGFTPDPSADPSAIDAWRYAYSDAGDLAGTSDARGCGVNYHYESAGRMIVEDYSPCEPGHATYSPASEVIYNYDTADPETASITDAAGRTFPVDASQYLGRVVSVADRGSKGVLRYDARGRVSGSAIKIAPPGGATPDDASTFAPRWYVQERTFDAADRPVDGTTGATSPELTGAGGASKTTATYTRRGEMSSIGSSYGTLLASSTYAADGLMTSMVYGDLAATERAYSYDDQRRLRSTQTFRAGPGLWTTPSYSCGGSASQQLLLEDLDFTYDQVGNMTEIADWRIADEWPDGSKPASRRFEYDDQYRLTRTRYDYATASGSDPWTSPFAAENAGTSAGPKPSPHVEFENRVLEQRYSYDHLGNITRSSDDASGFFDRSLGTNVNAVHRLTSASNRSTGAARQGDLEATYDAAGNMTSMVVRRDGECLPAGASCWQRFEYSWDELGRLARAKRWDLAVAERTVSGAPARAADVELRYVYDGSGGRVVKTAVDPAGAQLHTVYVFGSLELRRSAFSGGDYALSGATESVLLPAGGARARVVYSESAELGGQRVFLEMADHLGSTASVIDLATGELVEASTSYAYGGSETDYRPERWGEFREPYKFGGKEEDQEVGLAYFGKRYLVIGLGRWASADPVTIHYFRADPNPYAYVGGRPITTVDPDGGEPITLAIVLTAIAWGAVIGAGTGFVGSAAYQWGSKGSFGAIDWGDAGIAAGAGAAGGAVGGPLVPALGGGVVAFTVGGGMGSGTSYIVHAKSTGAPVTPGGLALAVGLGAAGGALTFGALRLLSPRAGVKPPGPPPPAGTPSPGGPPAPAAPTPPGGGAAQTVDDFLPEDGSLLFQGPQAAPKAMPGMDPAPKVAPGTPGSKAPIDASFELRNAEPSIGTGAGREGVTYPTGRSGHPLNVPRGTNAPATIGGRQYSGHSLDEMQADGIMPSVVDDAIRAGGVPGRVAGTTAHYSYANNVTVITDSGSGRVVTVGRGYFGE